MRKIGSCFITSGDEVETLSFDWGDIKVLSAPDRGGGESMTVAQVVLQPGQGHERHEHPDADEVLFFLSGRGEQMLDDKEPVPVSAGDSVYIPRGVFHSTVNAGWEPLRFVAIYAPAGPEEVLRSLPDVRVVPAGEVP